MANLGLVIALEEGVSDEGLERIRDAILMMRGVLSVEKEVQVNNHENWMTREQIRREVFNALFEVLNENNE